MPCFQGNKHTNSLDYIGKKIKYHIPWNTDHTPSLKHTTQQNLTLSCLPKPVTRPAYQAPYRDLDVSPEYVNLPQKPM